MASSPTFQDLVSRYGLNAALALMPLLDADSSASSKAFAGVNLAGTGANAAGAASGLPALAQVGQGIGTAAGLAGTGYNVYQDATNPNLSNKQRAAHAGGDVASAIFSYLFPIYGAAKALQVVGKYLERSGSPQVRGAGTAIDYAVEPAGAKSFLDVLRADKSPAAAVKAQGGAQGLVLDLLGPLGIIARGTGKGGKVAKGIMDYGPIPFGGKLAGMLGMNSKPTTGTMFRHELGSIFDKIPQLKGTDLSKYNMPTGGYGQYAPGVFDKARQAGGAFAGRTADAAKNPDAYATQATNILLAKFGNQLPQVLQSMLQGKAG